nr:ribonuclease H-like domain-containing protein [Tanacetum cinerariifolium]
QNRTLIEATRSMLADSKLPIMFWTEAVSTACYVLKRVSITNPHNKTPYELLSGKVPNIRHLKPFGCQVTILNTSDHLGKFEGKANDSFLVGYAANRVYNLSSKKVEETLNLRYLEDKPNVQGLGQEWYFDLDYLTDSLGYTRFKTNTPAGTQDSNINAGTQDDDSESECDEHAILVPSFPSNSFSGPKVNDVSAPMKNNLDYAEELARPQRQEHEAHSTVAKNLVLAAGDPAGSIVSTGGVPAGSVPAGSVPASHVPASSVHARSVPASNVPAGGVLAGSIDSAGFGDPAASESVPAVFTPDHVAILHFLLVIHWAQVNTLQDFPLHLTLEITNLRLAFSLPLPMMMIFNKRDARGIVVRNKARLVGQGHRQEEGIDYDEFDMESVRTTTTPYEVPKHKSKDEPDDDVNVHLFISMIGSLMYLIASRLDIMFADDHNKVAYLEKGKVLEAYEQILDFLNRSHIRYALTHRPSVVFDSLVKQFWATATVRTLEAGPSDILATIDGNEVMVTESLITTQLQLDDVNGLYDFTLHDVLDGMRAIGYPTDGSLAFYKAKLSPQWRFLIHTLIHCMIPAGGDAAGAVANVAAGLGPSSAPQVPPVREHSPMREHSHVMEPTPVWEPSPRPEPEPTPDSPSPLSPPPSSAAVGPTTSSRPPSPSRHPSGPDDIREGGGDFASSPPSNEAPQTPAATAVGGAEDSAVANVAAGPGPSSAPQVPPLDECLHRVTTLENELGITKKVLGGVVLKCYYTEQEFDLAALHTLASTTLGDDPSATAVGPDVKTTMPGERTSTTRRHLRKPFTSSVSAHVSETIPPGVRVPAAATTIPASSSVDVDVHTAVVPSSSIPTAADKGKAPMVDNSPPADLLSEHERVLKNLHDSQLGEELAKMIQAEQEAEFARQQEELAQKAQAESVASPTAHGQWMSDQRHRELDAAQLIYTEADWLDLANLGDDPSATADGPDVETTMPDERTSITHRCLRKSFTSSVSAHVSETIPLGVRVPVAATTIPAEHERVLKNLHNSQLGEELAKKIQAEQEAEFARQQEELAQKAQAKSVASPTAHGQGMSNQRDDVTEENMNERLGMLLMRKRRELAEQSRVKPMTKTQQRDYMRDFVKNCSASVYNQGWTMKKDPAGVPAAPSIPADASLLAASSSNLAAILVPVVSIAHATVLFLLSQWCILLNLIWMILSLLLIMVLLSPLLLHLLRHPHAIARLLGAVDALYQSEEPDSFALILWGDLHVLFQSLDDKDALHFWRTLERMLKHRLEVSKLLVGRDLTMAEQLIGFIKAALLNAKSAA